MSLKMIGLSAGIILSLVSLVSIKFLKSLLHPIEIFIYHIFFIILFDFTVTIPLVNLKSIKLGKGWEIVAMFELGGLIFYPLIAVWLMVLLGSGRVHLLMKLFYFCLFVTIMTISDWAYTQAGFVKLITWKMPMSLSGMLPSLYPGFC